MAKAFLEPLRFVTVDDAFVPYGGAVELAEYPQGETTHTAHGPRSTLQGFVTRPRSRISADGILLG